VRHARRGGCGTFDFGRSKAGSGPTEFKKNWGFEGQPLAYAGWTAPGAPPRDADPASARNSARIELWKRLPLAIANRFGAKAYDTDGTERRGEWISQEPARFQTADLSYEQMKEEAAALGLIMRPLTFKQGAASLGLFA